MNAGTVNASNLKGLLGYLNFSTGRPDPRVQAQLFDVWVSVAEAASPRLALYQCLAETLSELHSQGNAAFENIAQAQAVLDLAFRHLPAAYRRHHEDLLGHLHEADLFPPGFLVRASEAVLSQQGPWEEGDRILAGALKQLNNYVGYRPIAVLETRPRGEPYDHEMVCPVPLYLRGAGVVPGKYAALIHRALDILRAAKPALLTGAWFDLTHLDELAIDPRAYDHHHPADKRPNYRFGEWDPHHIDNRGFYCRMVMRQIVLDGMMNRVQNTPEIPAEELLQEAATVLAGTMLMASGISGAGPETHDSSVSLSTLMPSIARCRDAFYKEQLAAATGSHGDRLREESARLRQPLGGARQHINQYLAQQRAAQLQQRRLALLVAELGQPEAARRNASRVPAASLRMLAEIHVHLTTCQVLAESGKCGEAADQLARAEEVLHRAIACGAMVDPWNILGFQGLFPLFIAREDSVPDHRIGELVQSVERMLSFYANLRSEAAATGDAGLALRLATKMEQLAAWWDGFATTTVNDIPHLSGHEAAASADHVAQALTRWRERGKATADLGFWREQLSDFHSAKSFALVVMELLRKNDFRAAMALLMNWLSQADQVPLEQGEHSFHNLALRWMLGLTRQQAAEPAKKETEELARKFIDYLEANAEDYWQVPRLGGATGEAETIPAPDQDSEDSLFGAAYEDVSYKDSTDDGVESELLGFEPRRVFELEQEAQGIEQHLKFLSTVARLLHVASRLVTRDQERAANARETLRSWLATAVRNQQELLALMDSIHERPIPPASGSYDSLVEFDRRNVVKQRLQTVVIGACLDWAMTVGGMQGITGGDSGTAKRPRWEPSLMRMEQGLWRGDADGVKSQLPNFLEHFQHEPLLYVPLAHGGNPRLILRSGIAQTLLRALVANLPRMGLLRETYSVLRVAQTMEREQKLQGPRLTEFDRLFQIACQASVEAAVEAIRADDSVSEGEAINLLGQLIEPYQRLWTEHSGTLRLSILETVTTDADWANLREFIRKYGGGLFHARFMTLGNLRGILHGGVGAYLKHLEENPDPQNPLSLIEDLEKGMPRPNAERQLQVVMQAVVENYEEYKDYNTTTPLSDYGENLYVLLDFLRLKAAYDRQAWVIRPLGQVHEVTSKYRSDLAALWQQQVEKLTSAAAEQFGKRLTELEKEHGVKLRTIEDRVRERFVLPLALDRACALIEPLYDASRHPGDAGRARQLLEQWEQGIKPFVDAPAGVGLDLPNWLRRLEGEAHRVRMHRSATGHMAENLMQIPRLVIPVERLREQLQDWPKP